MNGELRQKGRVGEMKFPIGKQIEYLSKFFTLEPGDVLLTGTPAGIGALRDPPEFLQPGDVVRCEIDGLGWIENRIVERALPPGTRGL